MRSILTFVAVVSGIIFIHASDIKLPETPAPAIPSNDVSIPGTMRVLPAPAATEAMVYMNDSLFQAYRGNHNYFVTGHYHVLYVKTDSGFVAAKGPLAAKRLATLSLLYR